MVQCSLFQSCYLSPAMREFVGGHFLPCQVLAPATTPAIARMCCSWAKQIQERFISRLRRATVAQDIIQLYIHAPSHLVIPFIAGMDAIRQEFRVYPVLVVIALQEFPVTVSIVDSLVLVSQKLVQKIHHLNETGVAVRPVIVTLFIIKSCGQQADNDDWLVAPPQTNRSENGLHCLCDADRCSSDFHIILELLVLKKVHDIVDPNMEHQSGRVDQLKLSVLHPPEQVGSRVPCNSGPGGIVAIVPLPCLLSPAPPVLHDGISVPYHSRLALVVLQPVQVPLVSAPPAAACLFISQWACRR
mmetsp:Transcript_36319/g.102615  ORF Transcript_36319/g.102615 Transcript_36319/m.102615 type:complete len:301 (+) Transcript_36319:120-1022(+)